MLRPKFTNKFKKQYELMKKRGLKIALLDDVMKSLLQGDVLDAKYRDHLLTGNFAGYRECHIQPDWLLIYYIEQDAIAFIATGTHSDLF